MDTPRTHYVNRALPIGIGLVLFPLWIVGLSLVVTGDDSYLTYFILALVLLFAIGIVLARPAWAIPTLIITNGTFAFPLVTRLTDIQSLNITLAEPVVVLLLVAVSIQPQRPKARYTLPLNLICFIYALSYIVSFALAQNKSLALPRVVQNTEFVFLPLVITTYVRTRTDFRRLLAAFVFVSAGLALYTSFYQIFIARLTKDITIFNGNSFGQMFDLILPILVALYLGTNYRTNAPELDDFWLRRRVVLVVIGLTFVAELLTFSRGSYLGVLVGFILLAIITRQAILLRILPILGFVIVATIFLLPEETLVTVTSNQTLGYREINWDGAAQVFALSPFFGAGVGNIAEYGMAHNIESLVISRSSDPHNFFFRTAAEMGLIGLIVLALIFVIIGRRLFLNIRLTRQRNESVFFALNAGIAGALVANVVHCYYDVFWVRGSGTMWWMLAGLAYAIPLLLDHQKSAEENSA